MAFADDEKRATLNSIVHPLVARRRAEIIAAVSEDAVVVEDIPLLVETGMAPMFPLVVVVHADMRAASDSSSSVAWTRPTPGRASRRRRPRNSAARSPMCGWTIRACGESWSNSPATCGTTGCCRWHTTYATHCRGADAGPAIHPGRRRRTHRQAPKPLAGTKALRVDHIGSTAVPGLDAKDVIDIQVTVASLDVADEFGDALAHAGYPRVEGITSDMPQPRPAHQPLPYRGSCVVAQAVSRAADPGRPANIHLRVDGGPTSGSRCCSPTG